VSEAGGLQEKRVWARAGALNLKDTAQHKRWAIRPGSDVRVGWGGGLAARLEKKGTFPCNTPPSPQRGGRSFPHMGRPTDKASSAFRHPRGGGLNIKVGTTPPPDQVGGWVSDQPQKNRPLIGQMFFCPPLGPTYTSGSSSFPGDLKISRVSFDRNA